MPLRDEEAAVDPQLEKATEFANRAMDKAGVPAETPEPKEAREPAERRPDPGEMIDRFAHPAHERARASRRDREIQQRLEAMEARVLERVEKLVPKPPPPAEPDFQSDPVAWQEWRDRQFREGIVGDIIERLAPPQDPERASFGAEQRQTHEEVGASMRDYVETTYQAQGYTDLASAWDGMQQRSNAYQTLRTQEIMAERGVDWRTAEGWKNREVAETYRWAKENDRDPIAVLDGLAMRKIAAYAGTAGTTQKESAVDEDARERQRAASSSMAGSISSTAAPRSNDAPLRRLKLGDVPADRKGYADFVAKNRQPGETFVNANRRIQAHFRGKAAR